MKEKVRVILPYIIIIVTVLFIKAFIVTPIKVNGESMQPTLHEGDIMILNETAYYFSEPKRFDIVVVNMPNEYLIKRVIGLPGEHVEYKDGNLYIDGFIVKENFNHKSTNDFKLETIGYLTIPGDKYLVVGDNRPDSTDSRVLGLFDKKDILGSVSLRIFPLNKIGSIN